ncbi:MAG: hypothetical protein DYG91_00805 [Chloroflexi bacterium CFX7]|nr:hypothetical protein [Chloroflexi bacterium CFX7]
MGSPDEAAERALERLGGETEVEARLAAELAAAGPLAHPERFPEAHRLAVRALEVLEREGSRNPRVGRLGPLAPVARMGVEFVAEYIVKSYAQAIAGRLRTLYTRREAQCPPALPERRLLARARMEMDRIAPGFQGGGVGAPIIVVVGAAVPLLASLAQSAGAIPFSNRGVQLAGVGLLLLLFLALSSVLLRGAAVAHRRSRLIMQQPLAALWDAIGHAGAPPEDDSVTFATIAIVLTAVVWFVLPALAVILFVAAG